MKRAKSLIGKSWRSKWKHTSRSIRALLGTWYLRRKLTVKMSQPIVNCLKGVLCTLAFTVIIRLRRCIVQTRLLGWYWQRGMLELRFLKMIRSWICMCRETAGKNGALLKKEIGSTRLVIMVHWSSRPGRIVPLKLCNSLWMRVSHGTRSKSQMSTSSLRIS